MQNPPVVMQILLVPFIICISTKVGKKPTRGEKGREAAKEENGGNSLVEDSSPPSANAKWYWNEKAGEKEGGEGHMGREKERSGRFRLRFPGERAGWPSPRSSREREKSGKKRGGDASITLEKR